MKSIKKWYQLYVKDYRYLHFAPFTLLFLPVVIFFELLIGLSKYFGKI